MALDIKNLLGPILSFGSKALVGVDIGYGGIKLAQVSRSGNTFQLDKFVSVDLPEASIIDDDIQKPDEIVAAIKEGLSQAGIEIRNACVGLSGPNTVIKRLLIEVEESDKSLDIGEQVIWESEQYLPFSVDDASIDFHIIGDAPKGKDVLVVAATNDVVVAYSSLLAHAGLKLKCIDSSACAIVNVFEYVMKENLENSDETIGILDFGAQKTHFIIYRNGSIAFHKEIFIGGRLMTEEIQNEMGLSHLEAEGLKINGDGNGNLPEEIVKISRRVVNTFVDEVVRILEFYKSASSDKGFNRCFVTGGASHVPGLLAALAVGTGVKPETLNPFTKFTYDERYFSKDILAHVAGTGVVALGLAMRELGG